MAKMPSKMPTKMPVGMAKGSLNRMGLRASVESGGKNSITKKGMPQKAGKPLCK